MPTLTRKVQLIPVGDKEEIDRVYKWIRNGQEVQAIMMNTYMSVMFSFMRMHKLRFLNMKEMKGKGIDEEFKELTHKLGRIPDPKKGDDYSYYDYDLEKFPKGLPLAGGIPHTCKPLLDAACKKGLMWGKCSLPSYRSNIPLDIHVDYVKLRSTSKKDCGLYHNYADHTELLKHLNRNDAEVFFRFPNNITFKVIFGNPKRSAYFRKEFQMIFEEYYRIQGSSLQFDKTGKKILLNMCINIPEQKKKANEDTVVGVNLGIMVPAACALNNDPYKRLYIGSADEFIRVREKIRSMRSRLSSGLKDCSGGHGRNKKLNKLYMLDRHERHFAQSYNHMVSKRIVDFALKNHAKYINLEDTESQGLDEYLLGIWSYYELQQFVSYKAQKYGIIVRKANPYRISQTCSCCGHWEEGQRVSRADFRCKNPECANYNKDINAEYNAARNVALSVDLK